MEAATQVAVSTVHYLRRRFQQWAAETRATFSGLGLGFRFIFFFGFRV